MTTNQKDAEALAREAFIKEVLEVAEHLQVDNGLLTASEQYDLGEQLYSAVQCWETTYADSQRAKQVQPGGDVVELVRQLCTAAMRLYELCKDAEYPEAARYYANHALSAHNKGQEIIRKMEAK